MSSRRQGAGAPVAGRPPWATAALLAVLAGCGASSSATGGMQVPRGETVFYIWENPRLPPLVVVSERTLQDARDSQKARLDEVLLRLPLHDGELLLTTDRAQVDNREGGSIVLEPPVYFSGAYRGLPLLGRAEAVEVRIREARLLMRDVDVLYAGQETHTDHLQVQDEWRERRARPMRSRPLAPPLAAALAALPRPLFFAAYREDQATR